MARLSFVILLAVTVVAIALARRNPSGAVDGFVEPAADQSAQITKTVVAPTKEIGDATIDRLPILTDAAPPVRAAGWLNTAPLSSTDLAGKVVLYDFWTFGCINCRNTLPWVKAWHGRYADDGLVVLSVHTPEFSYEADPKAVQKFVDDEAILYPVALDPDKKTWRAFSNRYWPAFYLHDRQGRRRYVHFGEGRYVQTEDALRSLLGVGADSPRAVVAPR